MSVKAFQGASIQTSGDLATGGLIGVSIKMSIGGSSNRWAKTREVRAVETRRRQKEG
jgi:uncharacterized membrane protein